MITDYDELAEAIRELHRPKVTSAGLRCSVCARWVNHSPRLVRDEWPCATIRMVMPMPDPNFYAS